ncbi:tetratricopeptide repeat protein [Geomobilimonas luticola]|uniref:Tetratricopeptide repeat protein n=1 Tax=Geomobilimonas luticola TaxID=1114878 RepID=A0ABS5SEG9_9BACT|nr:tetratricopeptide repeat protein [Geomobilimonas luticola]MBT0653763.1 tetratricopeptide repeat protein [Geomobilimonas luticola]
MRTKEYNGYSLLLPSLVLLVVVFAVYGGVLHHNFLDGWDDDSYVTANRAVQGITIDNVKAAFTSIYVGNYAPLQIVSYMVDYAIWGPHAIGFLLTNILLHAANGLLYFALARRLAESLLPAFVAAFIFLFHPVQVETVAWISQRKTLLAMFFFLSALHAWVAWRERKEPTGVIFYAVSLGAFCCAVLAKSVAVVLPVALLLYDLCFVAKNRRQGLVAGLIPFLLIALAFATMNFVVQDPALGGGGGRAAWHGGGPLATLYTMLPVVVRYLGMLVWPTNLSAFYDPPIRNAVDLQVALAALLLAVLTAGMVFLWKRKRKLFFWGGVFWLGLLPVSQVVPLVTLMNDRYLYFPLLGLAMLCGVLLACLADALGYSAGRTWTVVPLLVFLLPLPFLAWERTKVWQNSLTLWSDVVVKSPTSKWGWIGLAEAYRNRNQTDMAIQTYQRVLSMDPASVRALINLGRLYTMRGDTAKGRGYLLKAVELYPGYSPSYVALGENYYRAGEWEQAVAAYGKARALDPQAKGLDSVLHELKGRAGSRQ